MADQPNPTFRTELIERVTKALSNSTPMVVERDEFARMTEAVIDEIWPVVVETLDAVRQGTLAECHGMMRTLRVGLADQIDTFAEGGYGQHQETSGWRRGMHYAASMLRSRPEGQ